LGHQSGQLGLLLLHRRLQLDDMLAERLEFGRIEVPATVQPHGLHADGGNHLGDLVIQAF
jgi:hypothetical protein